MRYEHIYVVAYRHHAGQMLYQSVRSTFCAEFEHLIIYFARTFCVNSDSVCCLPVSNDHREVSEIHARRLHLFLVGDALIVAQQELAGRLRLHLQAVGERGVELRADLISDVREHVAFEVAHVTKLGQVVVSRLLYAGYRNVVINKLVSEVFRYADV